MKEKNNTRRKGGALPQCAAAKRQGEFINDQDLRIDSHPSRR
jgi:hypothetical protein